MEIPKYINQTEKRYEIDDDYALEKKLMEDFRTGVPAIDHTVTHPPDRSPRCP